MKSTTGLVELLDEKAINSTDQPLQRTNDPTKHANVRWADIVKEEKVVHIRHYYIRIKDGLRWGYRMWNLESSVSFSDSYHTLTSLPILHRLKWSIIGRGSVSAERRKLEHSLTCFRSCFFIHSPLWQLRTTIRYKLVYLVRK